MEKELFNDGWLFYNSSGTSLEDTVRGKVEPVAVTLPHDAMVLEKRDPDSPSGNATGFYPYKTVHYLKNLHIDKLVGSVYICFEGVYMNTAVYVNGALAIRHMNGYTPFTADISPYLTEGDNTIKVLVRNSSPSSRWYSGTGIYRDVYLLRGGNVHIAPEGGENHNSRSGQQYSRSLRRGRPCKPGKRGKGRRPAPQNRRAGSGSLRRKAVTHQMGLVRRGAQLESQGL
ncbi:MAG: hypothetical protein IJ773_12655 [Lachnospiraceae bacterium]|nr:hypothetical protein [Lachnospiraceae bacterium]